MSSHDAFRKLITTPDLPQLGPQRRAGTANPDELSRALQELFNREKIPTRAQPLLRSAALLWHDHFDESHTISQNIETPDGSWLHGIMHRREPDYGNAKYWFRRVGQHEAFPKLAAHVAMLLNNDNAGLIERLIKNGDWMPFVFVDECERAEQKKDATLVSMLQRIQAVEFDVLVEHIFSHAS